MKVSDIQSIRIRLASPEEILKWSYGEVKKPETVNYRTQRAEKDGLFCEKIFGPCKDYECYCGKYKGVRYKGVVCDRCGVEVIKSQVRRERMGHIELASPVSHIWFLRAVPSGMGLVLDIPQQKLEKVIYFIAYIIKEVDLVAQEKILKEVENELKKKIKQIEQSKMSPKERKKARESFNQKFLRTKEEISNIKPLNILSEIEYQELSLKYGEIFTAGTGSETLLNIFEKVNFKKEISNLKKELENSPAGEKKRILRRLRLFQGMEKAGIRPEWMFWKVLPVLPPDLRPMVQLDGGRYASSDLNDLYRRVINRNNRLKNLIEISAPEAIIRNEKRMLQEAVDSLLDNGMRRSSQLTKASTGGQRQLKSLADMLSGKQGRFRKNLLGKRVDYSGRSVIAPGPELKLHQCGIPKIMALELFRPFIIKDILDEELSYNIKGASRLIDDRAPEVFAALEKVVKDKLVLLNRAPTLHRLGVQAFEPVLIEGEAIRLHPLVCNAFNADFDGDQMAVYLPLSNEAQKEAKEIMLSSRNFLKPSTGDVIVSPTKDIVLGIYWLTGESKGVVEKQKIFGSFEEVITTYHLGKLDIRKKIKVCLTEKSKKSEIKIIETTCGRIIFNNALPQGFPFVNEKLDSGKLNKLISKIILEYSKEETAETLDNIKELGFEKATLSGISLGMDDFPVPKEKKYLMAEKEKEVDLVNDQQKKGLISQEEKELKIIEIWQEAKEELKEKVIKEMSADSPLFSIVDSGARGSWIQPIQICGMKGLVTSPSGEIIKMPIKNSFKEGLDVLEFFISTHGARKGTVDTALRTSASGYLTRRLVDVSHELIITEEDCGEKEGTKVYKKDADDIGQNFVSKIVGRVSLENIKSQDGKTIIKNGEIIDWDKAKEISATDIKSVIIRSPLSCKTLRGICQKCYGWEMGSNKLVKMGLAVGVIASQSIGEPGTQLTLRTFHTGGVVGGGDITQGLPRVEEVFELRNLKGEGVINITKGRVQKVDLERGEIFVKPDSKKEKVLYLAPLKSEIFVKKGDKVSPGQILSSGPLDQKKLFKTLGVAAVQRYIVKEILRVYVSEGINIHDKHIETITRQMFSRVKITEAGDSPWIPGQVVSRAEFEENQKEIEPNKRAKAQAILLGISQVALTSDSFLSAASFQQTSRVLIKASLEGKEDNLRGLKENVIIGRMIPAGTGFRKQK